ncbi:hypothetical protein HOY80DRAFT_1113316 [Tuber brumale]|nr:hypothetical protein HOY80DRAFT_1113316 [Tuber brumale]
MVLRTGRQKACLEFDSAKHPHGVGQGYLGSSSLDGIDGENSGLEERGNRGDREPIAQRNLGSSSLDDPREDSGPLEEGGNMGSQEPIIQRLVAKNPGGSSLDGVDGEDRCPGEGGNTGDQEPTVQRLVAEPPGSGSLDDIGGNDRPQGEGGNMNDQAAEEPEENEVKPPNIVLDAEVISNLGDQWPTIQKPLAEEPVVGNPQWNENRPPSQIPTAEVIGTKLLGVIRRDREGLRNMYGKTEVEWNKTLEAQIKRGEEMARKLIREMECSYEVALDLTVLTLYDVVILIDDSGSMIHEEGGRKKEALVQFIDYITEIYSMANESGILAMRFMNSRGGGERLDRGVAGISGWAQIWRGDKDRNRTQEKDSG